MADKTTVKGRPSGKTSSGLSRKVGPLPAYAWAAIVAVVVVFFYLRHRRNAQASPGAPAAGLDTVPSPSPLQGASSGQPSSNSSPLQGIDPGLLPFLGDSSTGGQAIGGIGLPAGHRDTYNYQWAEEMRGYTPDQIWAFEDQRKKGNIGGLPQWLQDLIAANGGAAVGSGGSWPAQGGGGSGPSTTPAPTTKPKRQPPPARKPPKKQPKPSGTQVGHM